MSDRAKKLVFLLPVILVFLGMTTVPSGGWRMINSARTTVIEFFDTGDAEFSGDVTAASFIGDGSALTGVSGDFTSSTITGLTEVVPAAGDFIIGTDATDSNALKKFDIEDILGAGGGVTDGATLSTGLTFPVSGLHILDTNASHDLILNNNFDLTADRTLNIIIGDSNRTFTLTGDASLSGTNTGDQTITLTGDVTGTGTGSFSTTIAAGAVDIAMINATGTPSGSTVLYGDGTWGAVAGGITDGDTLSTGFTFPLAGLHILDTNATHDLILSPGSNLTADRTLTITTGDQDRTLQISGTANVGTGTFTGTNTGDQTITLQGDVTGTGTGTFTATIATDAVDIAMLSATGTASGSTFLRGDNTWATPAGSGDVSKVGTPVDGQVGVWTGDGTIEGDASLTFDTVDDALVIAASGKVGFGAVDILSDSAGTTTLANIDAIDATTEGTIEAALDTLANLTSIQGQGFTVAGTTSVTGTNTGDQTITMTGDVTGSGTTGITTTIAAGAVDIAMLSATGTPDSTKFLRGDNTWQVPAGTGDALTSNPLSQFAATTSSQFSGVISDETGTGAVVLANSPTLVTPNLGTPSALTLTNASGLPGATGITGDIPFSNITQINERRLLGRALGAGTGDVSGLTLLEANALLNTAVGITSTANSTAWNSDNGRTFTSTLTEATTIAATSGSGMFDGQMVRFIFTQSAGGYVISWNAEFVAGADFTDTIPANSTTSGDVDMYLFTWFPSPTSKWVLMAHITH